MLVTTVQWSHAIVVAVAVAVAVVACVDLPAWKLFPSLICHSDCDCSLPELQSGVIYATPGSESGATHFDKTHPAEMRTVHDLPVPSCAKTGELLLRMEAAGVNPIDWKRAHSTWTAPGQLVGADVGGTVIAVGNGCAAFFRTGDEVFGLAAGSFAEYITVSCAMVIKRPPRLGTRLRDLATLPVAAATSLEAMLNYGGAPWAKGKMGNTTVAITAGAGGTGVAAIQQARALGASRIVAAASPRHWPLLKTLGADVVIDYHKHSLWEALPPDSVDVVFDNLGAPGTSERAMKSIRKGGVYILVSGGGGRLAPKDEVKPGVRQAFLSFDFDTRRILLEMVRTGALRTIVQRRYPLEMAAEALRESEAGHVAGKLAIGMHDVCRVPWHYGVSTKAVADCWPSQ
jgi:NADPH:quinone reductase-like Zn-dependent oxidoreductase